MNLNFGAGFNPIPLVVLTTGEESTISFGGGFNFGLQYAHRINKKFELALDLNYQISSLAPAVSNASASFNRANIWATPSLIIPFKKNQMMNFKLGAGFNYNFLPTFKFDFSELGGGKGSWKYKEAFGFHTQLLFEINYSNLYTLNLGIRYVNLTYEFKPDNMYNPPVELQKPDGSAIDLLMGMAFHF